MDNDKTNNIYFPLCCLNYHKEISKTAGLLISYGVIEFGLKLMKDIELNDSDYTAIENMIDKYNIRYVNQNKDEDLFHILSAGENSFTNGVILNQDL